MGRQRPADQRAPSGRPSVETRDFEAEIAELHRRLEEMQIEVDGSLKQRNRSDNERNHAVNDRLAMSEEPKKARLQAEAKAKAYEIAEGGYHQEAGDEADVELPRRPHGAAYPALRPLDRGYRAPGDDWDAQGRERDRQAAA
jgi:hypothetical protein